MRGKLWFIGGMAAGFVLGARAGREKYEELVVRGRKVLDHPTVQEAAGVAQTQANRLYAEGKNRLGQTRLGERLSPTNGGGSGTTELDSRESAYAGTSTGSGGTGSSTVSSGSSGTSGSTSASGTSAVKSKGSGTANGTTI